MTLNTSFHKLEPYYLRGGSRTSLEGARNNEENDEELFELEENGGILETFTGQKDVGLQDNIDVELHLDQSMLRNPSRSSELPTSTPSTEESTQNDLSQVNPHLILDKTNKIPFLIENTGNKYPQRLNRGVPRKQ